MTDSLLNTLSLTAYQEAEKLGLSLDPEGGGDLTAASCIVRAVLEKLREPDEGMKHAAYRLNHPRDEEIFTAMIDHILNKSGKPANPT